MTFLEIIDALLLRPLQTLFELVYCNVYDIIGNPGLSIIALSLFMNILVLPLYNKADALQEEERQMEARLAKGVSHIKKAFRGDERMMILQTYYRQNHYKPTYVLRGAVSLMLEIPFFMAAYRFLSGLELLQGVSFGPIADLGQADGLLRLGGVSVNILPVIMTAVNLVSCVIFTKGAPKKTKIQLFGMAAFFLVFLYDSPSGLVFYWTLNNVFSLGKTIFYKLKNPGKVLKVSGAILGAVMIVGVLGFYHAPRPVVRMAVVLAGVALALPWLLGLRKNTKNRIEKAYKPDARLFFTCGLFLSLFVGTYIPLSVIVASAQEFVSTQLYQNPLWFVVSSTCFAVGLFVIWLGIFYRLASDKGKVFLERGLWLLSGVALVDFMFFGKDLGLLSSSLIINDGLKFEKWETVANILAVADAVGLLYLLLRKWNKFSIRAVTAVLLAVVLMIPVNVGNVNKQIADMKENVEEEGEEPYHVMSKDGKNVVVVMLDRALGEFVPYIFQEKPELKEQFDGFTVYSNVVSTGSRTIFGAPALLGGYDYTVENINSRDQERLVDKHNEALKVMPVLFSEAGYDVTLFDPPYTNYENYLDKSVYADYPEIKTFQTRGHYTESDATQSWIDSNRRNFFLYGIMKVLPLPLQKYIYGVGDYNSGASKAVGETTFQTQRNGHEATGVDALFMNSYDVLTNLPDITEIKQSGNTFLFMENETTHEPTLLQAPDYVPAESVDNTAYDEAHKDRFSLNGLTLTMESALQYSHYDVNMAALIQLGNWFDYLRESGVYDNTRIILVADHGTELGVKQNMILFDGLDAEYFYPLLMVKDFDAKGFQYSDEFMTTADVPALAVDGLMEDPCNPFTGNPISMAPKTDQPVYVFYSDDISMSLNSGNVFQPGTWYRIDNQNMRSWGNWVCTEKYSVAP